MKILQAAIFVGCPVFLESPRASQMWSIPPLMQYSRHVPFRLHKADFCQYGTPWKKPTTIASWNASHIPGLNRLCHTCNGICSRTNKPHIILSGCAP
eukprot:3107661-Pyramimonas_sp.AAC.1